MDKLWCWYDSGTCCPCPPRQFAADPHNQERWTVHKSSPGAITLRTIISSTCSQLIFVIAVLGPDNIVSDTSMFWFSGSCVSPISVWGMLLLCPITSPNFALDPQVFFHPVFRSPENKLENIEKLGRLNIFWIIKYFWSGTFNIFYGAPPLSQLNCNRELETGTGN